MKRQRNHLLAMVVIGICFSSIVLAQSHPEQDTTLPFDYENGDYTLITDWNAVEWSKIPQHRIRDVPPEKIVYEKLGKAQRFGMTPEQIALNFEKIEDLYNDVHNIKAEKAISHAYGFSGIISIYGSSRVRGGVLSALGEKHHSVPLSKFSKNANIRVELDGTIRIENSNVIPAEGTAEYAYEKETTVKLYGDKQIGIVGKVRTDKGKVYLVDGFISTEQIDLEIEQQGKIRADIPLYLDGGRHEGDGIMLDAGQGVLNAVLASSETKERVVLRIDFKPGNPFLPVEGNDKLLISTTGSMSIIHRDGIIPKVQMTDEFVINNGGMEYELFGNKLMQRKYVDSSSSKIPGSVPFTLSITFEEEEGKGKNTFSDHKVVFDNSNNYVVAPEEYPLYNLECTACAENLNANNDAFLVVQKGYPLMEGITVLSPTLGDDINTLQNIYQAFSELPTQVRDSVSTIIVLSQDEIKKVCIMNAGACAVGPILFMPPDTDNKIARHEAAHSYTFAQVRQDILNREGQLLLYELELARKYNLQGRPVAAPEEGCSIPPCTGIRGIYAENSLMQGVYSGEVIKISDDEAQQWRLLMDMASKQETFEDKWKALAGDVYGKDLEDPEGLFDMPKNWANGNSEPRHGCVTPYGCRTWLEDIAEYVEQGPGFFRNTNLIQPPGHPDHDPGKYCPVCIAKVNLLLEYGFITKEYYNKVFEEGK